MVAVQVKAQSVGVKTDRNQVLIGERLAYELLVNLPTPGYAINFKFPDSVAHFDVLENNNFDTLSDNSGAFLLHKKIVLTSFDSGAWHIPPFEVLLERNGQSKKIFTDSILVNVGYSPADSTGQLRDIKPVIEVTVTDYTWYYIAVGFLIALILAWFVYRYIQHRNKRPKPIFDSALSAYDEAMRSLRELNQYEPKNAAIVKAYYTSLAEIFKRYYSRRQSKNMINNTTGDILLSVKEHFEDASLVSALAEPLRSADAVKFAKYIPADEAALQHHRQLKQVIDQFEKIQSPPKQS
ncbi:hypothetical protein BH11BAC4_BH11BAC4_11390 [soil metagenome]